MADEIEEDNDGVPSMLLPCVSCNRTFRPEALAKHVKVCEKSLKKKRKVFDSSKQRIQGTELAEFLPVLPTFTKKSERSPVRKLQTQSSSSSLSVGSKASLSSPKNKWREKHSELVQTIQAARVPPTQAPSVPSKLSSQEQCPYCERSFGPKAYDRHLEWCREQRTRIQPKSPASQRARERLEARTKYQAPLTNKCRQKRSGSRDKLRDPSPSYQPHTPTMTRRKTVPTDVVSSPCLNTFVKGTSLRSSTRSSVSMGGSNKKPQLARSNRDPSAPSPQSSFLTFDPDERNDGWRPDLDIDVISSSDDDTDSQSISTFEVEFLDEYLDASTPQSDGHQPSPSSSPLDIPLPSHSPVELNRTYSKEDLKDLLKCTPVKSRRSKKKDKVSKTTGRKESSVRKQSDVKDNILDLTSENNLLKDNNKMNHLNDNNNVLEENEDPFANILLTESESSSSYFNLADVHCDLIDYDSEVVTPDWESKMVIPNTNTLPEGEESVVTSNVFDKADAIIDKKQSMSIIDTMSMEYDHLSSTNLNEEFTENSQNLSCKLNTSDTMPVEYDPLSSTNLNEEFTANIQNLSCKHTSDTMPVEYDRLSSTNLNEEFTENSQNLSCKLNTSDKMPVEYDSLSSTNLNKECAENIQNLSCKHTSETMPVEYNHLLSTNLNNECRENSQNLSCKLNTSGTMPVEYDPLSSTNLNKECAENIQNFSCKHTSETMPVEYNNLLSTNLNNECRENSQNLSCKLNTSGTMPLEYDHLSSTNLKKECTENNIQYSKNSSCYESKGVFKDSKQSLKNSKVITRIKATNYPNQTKGLHRVDFEHEKKGNFCCPSPVKRRKRASGPLKDIMCDAGSARNESDFDCSWDYYETNMIAKQEQLSKSNVKLNTKCGMKELNSSVLSMDKKAQNSARFKVTKFPLNAEKVKTDDYQTVFINPEDIPRGGESDNMSTDSLSSVAAARYKTSDVDILILSDKEETGESFTNLLTNKIQHPSVRNQGHEDRSIYTIDCTNSWQSWKSSCENYSKHDGENSRTIFKLKSPILEISDGKLPLITKKTNLSFSNKKHLSYSVNQKKRHIKKSVSESIVQTKHFSQLPVLINRKAHKAEKTTLATVKSTHWTERINQIQDNRFSKEELIEDQIRERMAHPLKQMESDDKIEKDLSNSSQHRRLKPIASTSRQQVESSTESSGECEDLSVHSTGARNRNQMNLKEQVKQLPPLAEHSLSRQRHHHKTSFNGRQHRKTSGKYSYGVEELPKPELDLHLAGLTTGPDSAYSSLNRKSPVGGEQDRGDSGEAARFCHECGAKYPLVAAKFCCQCGVRRLVI